MCEKWLSVHVAVDVKMCIIVPGSATMLAHDHAHVHVRPGMACVPVCKL